MLANAQQHSDLLFVQLEEKKMKMEAAMEESVIEKNVQLLFASKLCRSCLMTRSNADAYTYNLTRIKPLPLWCYTCNKRARIHPIDNFRPAREQDVAMSNVSTV